MNRRRRESAQHFLHTNRDVSLWVISLSFLAANCSALEVLMMIAVSVKYGMLAIHFYWVGAIPALAFLLCVVLPQYQQLKVRSIPEYLERRFGPSARFLSAAAFCALMIAVAGITLCLTSRLLHLVIGWSYPQGIWLMTTAVCAFLLAGGLSAVIYGEALQLLIFVLVLVPLTLKALRTAGGVRPLVKSLPVTSQHTFQGLDLFAPHAHADVFGIVVGLGFVLSFSYWCADFLLVQRLCAARNNREMLRIPSLAIVGKVLLPLVLVVPGLTVVRAFSGTALYTFDLTLPQMLLHNYPISMAAVAMAAMVASLFLSMCGNIAAGVAIFTSDLYRPFVCPDASDQQTLRIGRVSTLLMMLAAGGAAYVAFGSNALMEYVQLALSAFNVPVAAVLLAGIFFPRLTPRAGSPAIIVGTLAGILSWQAARVVQFGSGITETFYSALISFAFTVIAMVVTHLQSAMLSPNGDPLSHLNPVLTASPSVPRSLKVLALVSISTIAGLYLLFR